MNSPASFAATVHTALRNVGTASYERFGSRKVFVSAAFRAAVRAGYEGSLESFKAELVKANRAGQVELARADLVGAMDANAVAASSILDLNSEFHFIVDPAARDPWSVAA